MVGSSCGSSRGEDVAAQQLVGGADVGERALAEVLELEQLADEEVAVVHERVELGVVGAQLLDDPGAVDDVGVVGEGGQLVEVAGAEGHVALAHGDEVGVLVGELLQAAVHAVAIAGCGSRQRPARPAAAAAAALPSLLALSTTITRLTRGWAAKSRTEAAMLASSL